MKAWTGSDVHSNTAKAMKRVKEVGEGVAFMVLFTCLLVCLQRIRFMKINSCSGVCSFLSFLSCWSRKCTVCVGATWRFGCHCCESVLWSKCDVPSFTVWYMVPPTAVLFCLMARNTVEENHDWKTSRLSQSQSHSFFRLFASTDDGSPFVLAALLTLLPE